MKYVHNVNLPNLHLSLLKMYIFLGAMESIMDGVNIIYYTENVWGQFLFTFNHGCIKFNEIHNEDI